MAWLRKLHGIGITLALVPSVLAAQQGGTITGRVVDRQTQQPIIGATVRILGTTRGAQTNDQGTYRIAGVNAGRADVQALRLGYTAVVRPVNVVRGETATADLAMDATATQLDVVQITATGQQQTRRESGASTAMINVPEQVPQAAVTNLATVLSSRAAGVVVQEASGTTGSGARVRIRGANSVSLTNDPLIIVDGIRVNSEQDDAASSISVGGQVPSRLNDINPNEIEDIEVIRGPAAAALYGTAAANGVIQITTKRGRAGKTRWNVRTEAGTVNEVTRWPANGMGVEVDGVDTLFGCTNDAVARNLCTQTGIASYNPLEDNSPFVRGWRTRYGLDASGGSEQSQYFISGDFNREQGVYAINRLRQINLRANLHSQLRENLDVTVNSGYLQSRLRLPQNDNNVRGIIPGGLLGNIEKDATLGGYGFDTPANIMAINTQQNVDRFTGSARANWQPLSWLTGIGTAGIDFANRLDQEFIPPASAGGPTSQFSDDAVGKRTSNPFQSFVYTANAGLTASWMPRGEFRTSTSAGLQFNDEITRATSAYGQNILTGTSSLTGATQLFAVDEANVENKTLGAYVQEQIAWRERVFLSGAVRGDKNSAFGQDFKSVVYPAASVSWVIGEEGFFPKQEILSSLRLRSAYGESGQRPRFRDAIRFLTPAAISIRNGSDASEIVPGFFVGGVGNLKLKPERSGEAEIGFDAGFFRERVGTAVTYYSKTTRDALVSRILPLSNGESETRWENLGRVKNAGLEYQVNAQVFNFQPAAFELNVSGSVNSNKLVDLGEGIQPIIFNDSHQRHQNGYSLGGYWQIPISYDDKNHDGMLSRVNCPGQPVLAGGPECEVTRGTTEAYLGSPFPKSEFSVTPQLTLYKAVTVRALFNHRGGQKLLNLTERFRCLSAICDAASNAHAPLARQAAYIGALMGTDAGYIEDASFTKLREVSVAFGVPQRYLSRVGVSGATLTLAGRNLKTWTKYTGIDPEINEAGGLNFSTDEFLSQPHVRYWTARLDFAW